MDLSFLKNVEVKAVPQKNSTAKKATLEKFPVAGAHFRVYKNGRMFSNKEIAAKYNLNFGAQIEGEDKKAVTVGNGLDIFSSENWQMIKTEETILFVGIVARQGNSKIDVYGSTRYDEDGNPKGDINANSIAAFVKDSLIEMLETVYGVDFEECDFVDLTIAEEFPIKAPNDVYSIPKVVSRGDSKGQPVFVTRTNLQVFPLVVFKAEDGAETVDPDQTDLEDSIKEVANENGSAKEAILPA